MTRASTIDFYQVKADGTPDTSSQCALVAVGCLAVVSFEATYFPITPFISNILFRNGVTFEATSVLSVEYSCPLTPTDGRGGPELPEAAMTRNPFQLRKTEANMDQPTPKRTRSRPRGQILVVAAIAMISMIGGVALILEGGNAYAHQRGVQNAADAVANAGATVLAQQLGGATKTDADVAAAVNAIATANQLDSVAALLHEPGRPAAQQRRRCRHRIRRLRHASATASCPPRRPGVHATGNQLFDTAFARVIGINQFTASADATAIAGPLAGGQFLPVVFPVNIADCETNGDLGIERGRLEDEPARAIHRSARSTSCPCARPAAARS